MRMIKFLFWSCFLCQSVLGYIPPLMSMIQEIYENKKIPPTAEILFRHHITVEGNDVIELDERVVLIKEMPYFLFEGTDLSHPIYATLERGSYSFGSELSVSSRSGIYRSHLFGSSAERLKDRLLQEEFIYRDQLLQFKPGFVLQGDPKLWDIMGGYIRHEDILLKRLESRIAIAVTGLNKGSSRRILYFDKALRGIARTEWIDGSQTVAWNYDGFVKSSYGAFHPSRMVLEYNGRKVVRSDWGQFRVVKEKRANDFKAAIRPAKANQSISSSVENALKILLSYR